MLAYKLYEMVANDSQPPLTQKPSASGGSGMTVAPSKFGVQLSLQGHQAADPSCPLRLLLSGSTKDGDGFLCDLDQGGYAVTEDLRVVPLVDVYDSAAEAEQVCQWLNQDFGHQLCARPVGRLRQQFATQQQAEDYRMAMLLAAITPDDNGVAVPPVLASLLPVTTAAIPRQAGWSATMPMSQHAYGAAHAHSCSR